MTLAGILQVIAPPTVAHRLLVISLLSIEVPAGYRADSATYTPAQASTRLRLPGRPAAERVPGRCLIPCGDGAFDLVVGHRLFRRDLDAAPLLHDAVRVLKPGGCLILTAHPDDLHDCSMPDGGIADLLRGVSHQASIQVGRMQLFGDVVAALCQVVEPLAQQSTGGVALRLRS